MPDSRTNETGTPVRDVVIIGSGPAGLTAAIYAARANLKPLVIEGFAAGGSLMNTTEVENFPSHTSILGPDLMESIRDQAEHFGAEFITDDVTEVSLTGDTKTVRIGSDPEVVRARTLILSTGSRWRRLGVPGEDRLLGHGVSSCATCDGFFFRGRDVSVVGGGDSAMEEALFLTRFAASVTVLVRGQSLRASSIMQERARAHEKIRFVHGVEVQEVLGDAAVTGLRLLRDGAPEEVATDALFLAIGHDPSSELFAGQLELDSEGYVVVRSPSTLTEVPGVFACGDLVDHVYRQAITAAGSGCAAALDAERYLLALPTEESARL